MTREEALSVLPENRDVINKIYDDFEQERREQAEIRNKSKADFEERVNRELSKKDCSSIYCT